MLRIERTLARAHKTWVDWRGTSGQVYFEHRVHEYREIWRRVAEQLGAQFRILADNLYEIELDGRKTRIHNYRLEFDDPVTLTLAANKPLVHRLLRENRIPVPEHLVFNLAQLDKAYAFLERQGPWCVIKPADGYGGKGVTTHIRTNREVRKAAILASLYSGDLLMESQIPGESYRILVICGRMVHAVCRRGLRLKGDGKSTISTLIDAASARLKQRDLGGLEIDPDCLFTLGYQKLSLTTIPARDERFLVRSINDPSRNRVEVRTVYNEVVTGLICDDIRRQAESAASIVNSDFLGVDIITTDPTVPLEESGGIVNEVNTTPALHHHYDGNVEGYPQAAAHAIAMLLRRQKVYPA
jgi:glutathione synthase/RimK-type ligase-like ATP-grasp enzyme